MFYGKQPFPISQVIVIQTKELISSNFIDELATIRGMSKGTIIKHLNVLKEENPDIDLDKFMPESKTLELVKAAFITIKERNNLDDFSEDGKPRLKPILKL